MSAIYNCPTCGEKMERDLVLFTKHTDAHIVEELGKSHPEWIASDGFCPPCLEHYKAARRGESLPGNIAGTQIARRWVLMLTSAVIAVTLSVALARSSAPRAARLLLFLPLFTMFLGYFQARRKTCVFLGLKGVRNMGMKEEPVKDAAQKDRLRLSSSQILFWSLALSFGLTLLSYWRG